MFKDLKHKTPNYKIPKTEKKLYGIDLGNDFTNVTPKAQVTKPKITNKGCIKLKSFRTAKETITRVKRQTMEWEKGFANHVSDNLIISKIYEELLLNSKKLITRFKKWTK